VAKGYRLDELARHVGGEVRGDPERMIRDVATLDDAGPDQLSFFTNPRYRKQAFASRAGAVLVGPGSKLTGHDLLVAEQPYLALARLLELFGPPEATERVVSPQAFVDPEARLGKDVAVGPFAVIERGSVVGDGVRIGAGCVVGADSEIGEQSELRPKVVLYPGTRVGRRCLLHSGVVLGADGFGFATLDGRHHKVPQLGQVVVEDEVEIGANSTVDRGAVGATVVGGGSKIDNLVQLAHGVQLGERTVIAAQSGIAGSTRVGAGATLAGQVGIAGHLEIGEGTVVAAKSAVFDDQSPGSFVSGIPAIDHRRWRRVQALVRRLPELRAELRQLRERLQALEQRLGDDGKE